MLKSSLIRQRLLVHLERTGYCYKVGSWLLLLLTLTAGCAQAQVPNVTYSGPLEITKGGTYSGNYRSNDSSVPVIHITTTEPVILQNCILVGPGELILADHDHTNLTIRECQGYGTTPTQDDRGRGVFLYMYKGQSLVMEHNYLEQNQGVVLDRWVGDGSSNQTVRIRYNRAVNIDGSTRNNPQQGQGCFALLNTVIGVGNIEIAWNQIINTPNKSAVGDNLNFNNSGGTGSSIARVHDNYVQGAYPVPATGPAFSGTGFTTDGDGQSPSTTASYIELDHNQFVSTCNAGINVASGHDINIHDNRAVTSGYLPSGEKLQALSCGITPFNYYKSPAPTFGNVRIVDNTVGFACYYASNPYPNRSDFCLALATTVSGNVSLPANLTVQTEQNEWALWQQKLQQNGITPGLSGSAPTPAPAPTTPAPAPTTPPAPAPTPPANATFYRAFDLNGAAATIDGNRWEAGSASGLQVTGGANFVGNTSLNPAPDAARTSMLQSSVYGPHVAAAVSNVPNASYLVYAYVWEDNNAETFSVSVNGKVVQSNYNSGAAGHWDRLGPYQATVTNGALTVNLDGGTANFSGLELWTVAGTAAPTSTPTANGFYRAFDLNGGATTIDGNKWEAGSVVQVAGGTSFVGSTSLNPAPDAARTSMLQSSVYGTNVQLTVPNVANASYLVYLDVWEDNNAETFSVSVNGKVAQSNYNSGAAGHWDRLGPYPATVTNGTLSVAVSGGTANCSGLEIWTAASGVATTSTSFYRAISLNGSAATIDGNKWEGASAANYSVNGSKFSLQSQTLTPSTDASRATMLRACQYSNSLDFQMTAVPNGTYQVSAYVWEDNFTETYNLALNGQTVASNLKTGAAGAWTKVGPYPVTVTNGAIRLTSSGGTVNLSGVEVWQQTTSASLTSTASSNAVAARSTAAASTAAAPASLYPNPLSSGQSQVQVEATVAQSEQVVVQVLSHMGALLRQATLSFPAGLSSQLLDVGNLAPGTYLIRFASGSLAGKTIGLVKND